MKLSRSVVLSALFSVLAAGQALAAPSPQAKRLADIANDDAAFRKAEAQQAQRNAVERAAKANGARGEFERLCAIKPVMTDAEIASCKKAYKL